MRMRLYFHYTALGKPDGFLEAIAEVERREVRWSDSARDHRSVTTLGLPSGLEPGAVLAGKYRVDRVLGEGGMGVVLAAHHLQLDEPVAIKLLLPETLGNPEAVARFAREARAAVKIKSEHVARVSDVGTLPNGAPFLVMEFLEGEDLGHWVSTRGALPIEQAVEFILQACEAIAEAHSLGIVHRDLKPANLYCIRRADGLLSIKVLDFGISKMTSLSPSGPDMGMTKTSAVLGSPLYMSPEQMQSARSVDARSDIWALGSILFELVAARPPFMGETYPELVLKVAGAPPESLRAFRPDVPEGLERVILRCLEKDRAHRYQNIGELALALLEFGPKRARSSVERVSRVISAAGLSASALALPPSSNEEAAPTPGTLATWGKTDAPRRKSRGWLAAVLGVAGVAAVALLVAARRGSDSLTPGASSERPASQPPTLVSHPSPVIPAPELPAAPVVVSDVAASPSSVSVPNAQPEKTAKGRVPKPTTATPVKTEPTSTSAAVVSARPEPKPTATSRTDSFGGRL